MQTLKLLSKDSMEDFFFENSRLIGVSSKLASYRMCALINRSFGLDFKIVLEIDVKTAPPKSKTKEQNTSLFDEEQNGSDSTIHYPAYMHKDICNEDSFMMLYSNKSEEHPLIEAEKWADFFIFIKGDSYNDTLEVIIENILLLPEISSRKEIEINNLKMKGKLMF